MARRMLFLLARIVKGAVRYNTHGELARKTNHLAKVSGTTQFTKKLKNSFLR